MKPLGKDPQEKQGEEAKELGGSVVQGSTVRFVMFSSHWVNRQAQDLTDTCV